MKRGPGVAVKIATAGIVDIHQLEGWNKESIQLIGKEAEEIFGELMDDYGKLADQRKKFSESLSKLANTLSEDKPLIFIIDELDRCRPTFAIDILESVKHFFDTQGIHFVLGCNLTELGGSLKHVYGQSLNSEEYLQKFIHLRVGLPISERRGDNDRVKYIKHLRKRSRVDLSGEFANSMFQETERIAVVTKMSFREIDRVCSYCALSAAYTPKNYFSQGTLIAGLSTLRVKHPDLFEKAKLGSLVFDDIRVKLGLHVQNEEFPRGYAARVSDLWKWHCSDNVTLDGDSDFQRWVSKFDLERKDVLPFLANTIADAFLIFDR